MKIFLFALILCISLPAQVLAEDKKVHDPKTDAHMEAWLKASTPGEQHKLLSQLTGNWDHTVKWWMSADGQPEVSKGRTVNGMIMGGRYLKQSATGTSMGQPFEGMGISGYDNTKEQFTSMWIDNMGTG